MWIESIIFLGKEHRMGLRWAKSIRLCAWVWMLLFQLVGIEQARSSDMVIDRLVARFNGEAIAESELLAEARLTLALKESSAHAESPLSSEFLRHFLTYLIDQHLVLRHMRRLGEDRASQAEVEKMRLQLVGRLGSGAAFEAFLRRFGISESQVSAMLGRELSVSRYLAAQHSRGRGKEGHRIENDDAELKAFLTGIRAGSLVEILGNDGFWQPWRAHKE